MTRFGRVAAVIAVLLSVITIATWNDSTQSSVGGDPQQDGKMLFRAKGCASCHIGPGSSSGMSVGPPLIGASDWAAERRPSLSAADYLAESMRTPSAFISPAIVSGSGASMPNLDLDEAEIAALVAYLLG